MNKLIQGRDAEDLAKFYLLKKGYSFIGKNVYVKYGELDLIMQDDDFLVFIEVKSINASDYNIYEALTHKKLERLDRSINEWLCKFNCQSRIWRLDFIGIKKLANSFRVEHYKFVDLDNAY